MTTGIVIFIGLGWDWRPSTPINLGELSDLGYYQDAYSDSYHLLAALFIELIITSTLEEESVSKSCFWRNVLVWHFSIFTELSIHMSLDNF